ncbi:9727_t:CDS:2 [Paraglomus brasilianum]|uniref:9727_t:CDS:1 n=1 Tax=Paraglomus brasilianum TaxID=144538 RepID=A0A9N9BXN1_9GLOM|nr:9727_t:CDS:2 [Paraglomus brasilianum]
MSSFDLDNEPEEKAKLIKQVIDLQEGLKALIDRVESVKKDHEKIQSSNQILQTYINNLMSSSVLSSLGANRQSLLEKYEKRKNANG